MDKIKNIHNNFIHNILKQSENASDFLMVSLPDDIIKHIDLTKIDYDDTGYVLKNFKEYFSDLVVKTRTKDNEVDIYYLVEHKSCYKSSEAIFLQILKYKYSMWEEDFKNERDWRIIIPVVLYHGEKKWKVPESFKDIFNAPIDIKKYLFDFKYILFDTKDIDKNIYNKLKNNIILLSSLLALKSAFEKDDIERVEEIIHLLYEAGLFDDIDRIEVIITYLIQTKNIDEKKLVTLIDKEGLKGGEIMQTVVDKWV
ncbi:unnamed protein product, partial [marine sediment metagenome]